MDTREEVSITYGKANPKTYWHCKACDVSITYGKANRKKCLNTVGGRMFQLPTVKRTIEMTLMDFLKKVSITYGKANWAQLFAKAWTKLFQLPTVKRTCC